MFTYTQNTTTSNNNDNNNNSNINNIHDHINDNTILYYDTITYYSRVS